MQKVGFSHFPYLLHDDTPYHSIGVYHYRGGSSITQHRQFRLIYRSGLPPHRKSTRTASHSCATHVIPARGRPLHNHRGMKISGSIPSPLTEDRAKTPSARFPHTGTRRVPPLSHRYVLEEHYLAGSERSRSVREHMRRPNGSARVATATEQNYPAKQSTPAV